MSARGLYNSFAEFWTDWLPTETLFLPQNVDPRSTGRGALTRRQPSRKRTRIAASRGTGWGCTCISRRCAAQGTLSWSWRYSQRPSLPLPEVSLPSGSKPTVSRSNLIGTPKVAALGYPPLRRAPRSSTTWVCTGAVGVNVLHTSDFPHNQGISLPELPHGLLVIA